MFTVFCNQSSLVPMVWNSGSRIEHNFFSIVVIKEDLTFLEISRQVVQEFLIFYY